MQQPRLVAPCPIGWRRFRTLVTTLESPWKPALRRAVGVSPVAVFLALSACAQCPEFYVNPQSPPSGAQPATLSEPVSSAEALTQGRRVFVVWDTTTVATNQPLPSDSVLDNGQLKQLDDLLATLCGKSLSELPHYSIDNAAIRGYKARITGESSLVPVRDGYEAGIVYDGAGGKHARSDVIVDAFVAVRLNRHRSTGKPEKFFDPGSYYRLALANETLGTVTRPEKPTQATDLAALTVALLAPRAATNAKYRVSRDGPAWDYDWDDVSLGPTYDSLCHVEIYRINLPGPVLAWKLLDTGRPDRRGTRFLIDAQLTSLMTYASTALKLPEPETSNTESITVSVARSYVTNSGPTGYREEPEHLGTFVINEASDKFLDTKSYVVLIAGLSSADAPAFILCLRTRDM